MPAQRIDHLVTIVRDLEAATRTYTGTLGFQLAWPRCRQSGGPESTGISLGNANLELLTATADDTDYLSRVVWQTLQTRGEGLFMIALDPGDLDATLAEIAARGGQVTPPAAGTAEDVVTGDEVAAWTGATPVPPATRGAIAFFCKYSYLVPAQKGGNLKIKKLDHVIIATADIDDALRLWERNVGLTEDKEMDHPLGAGFKVARLPIGDSFLELVQPVEKEGRFYEQFQERGEGLFSISLEVEDLDEAVAHLRGKGAKVSEPEPSIWPGARLARINAGSTHGVSIQLIERSGG
jgi:methylmalonyl-CoA/ethylmalonyl-CoA epimerase